MCLARSQNVLLVRRQHVEGRVARSGNGFVEDLCPPGRDLSNLFPTQDASAGIRYPSAPSRPRPSSAYSMSRSLTERPRRSASAASRSASSVGRTTVRRTQSSLSQTSSGVSDKLSPLGRKLPCRLLERDVAAQDAVAKKTETAEVREARPLRETREDRQMQWRRQSGDRQVDVDPPFELGPGRLLEPTPRIGAEQRLEPTRVEADGDHDEVVGDALALVVVLDRDDNLPVARFDRRRPAGERAESP